MDIKTFISEHPEVLYVSVCYMAKPSDIINFNTNLLGKWEARLVTDDFFLWPIMDTDAVFIADAPEEAMNALFTSYNSK